MRKGLVRTVRYFVLRPALTVALLAAVVVVVALIVAAPLYIGYIPARPACVRRRRRRPPRTTYKAIATTTPTWCGTAWMPTPSRA